MHGIRDFKLHNYTFIIMLCYRAKAMPLPVRSAYEINVRRGALTIRRSTQTLDGMASTMVRARWLVQWIDLILRALRVQRRRWLRLNRSNLLHT